MPELSPSTFSHVLSVPYHPHVLSVPYHPHVLSVTYHPHVLSVPYHPHVLSAHERLIVSPVHSNNHARLFTVHIVNSPSVSSELGQPHANVQFSEQIRALPMSETLSPWTLTVLPEDEYISYKRNGNSSCQIWSFYELPLRTYHPNGADRRQGHRSNKLAYLRCNVARESLVYIVLVSAATATVFATVSL